MQAPQIELLPLQAALSSDSPTILDVVVKIIPPQPESNLQRPHLNLGLVIDRSSSMSVKQRLVYAKAAARHIVQELSLSDRISITTFDRHVQTLVPSTLAIDKAAIIDKIQAIQVGKWTNLHAGWVEGGNQVNQHIHPETVNRVILLSDGWASAGITNLAMLLAQVQELAQSGISTTTMGVGNDYNEDWLEAMATKGDGNYYYINSPGQLPKFFQKEKQALIATVGQQVNLGIEPQGDVEVTDVLNDLEANRQGRFKLPNLIAGYPFIVVVQLNIPAMTQECDLCYFRLTWNSPEHSEPQILRIPFRLPIVNQAQLKELSADPQVQQQVALMLAARAKKEAIALADKRDYEAAQTRLQSAKALILEAPSSSVMELEVLALESLEADLRSRQIKQFRKRGHYQAHQATAGFDQTLGPWSEDLIEPDSSAEG